MYEFVNNTGRKFVLPLNPTTVGRVWRETGFDLSGSIDRLRENPEKAVSVLCSIARREYPDITTDALRASMSDSVLSTAVEQVALAMTDYFPPPIPPEGKSCKPSQMKPVEAGGSPSTRSPSKGSARTAK